MTGTLTAVGPPPAASMVGDSRSLATFTVAGPSPSTAPAGFTARGSASAGTPATYSVSAGR